MVHLVQLKLLLQEMHYRKIRIHCLHTQVLLKEVRYCGRKIVVFRRHLYVKEEIDEFLRALLKGLGGQLERRFLGMRQLIVNKLV